MTTLLIVGATLFFFAFLAIGIILYRLRKDRIRLDFEMEAMQISYVAMLEALQLTEQCARKNATDLEQLQSDFLDFMHAMETLLFPAEDDDMSINLFGKPEKEKPN